MKRFWKYLFPALFWTIIYASIRLVNDTTANERFWERPWHVTAIEMGIGIIVGYGVDWLLRGYVRRMSRARPVFDSMQVLREFLRLGLVSLVLINLVLYLVHYLIDDPVDMADIAIANILILLYVLLHYAISRGNNFLKAFIAERLQLEKIRNDQLSTELKFLKAQYHPHFLFNALNTIYFQMDEDVAGAKHSIEKFSELLRYQLYDQGQMVPVARELEYLHAFVELQKMRSSDRLELRIDIDERLGQQQVYPLLFLPLVENAFKYVGGDYGIFIRASAEGPRIRFSVTNSIPGNQFPVKPGGIGLENLRRRLELLYPEKHRLDIVKTSDSFKATIEIE